jgi:DNA repair protein RadC
MGNGKEVEYTIQPQVLRVQELPAQMQPRETFDRLGAENVSDAVLLAILIRSGVPGQNVAELAQQMLIHFGSLTALARASQTELQRFRGIGPVTAQLLKAALELAQRITRESFGEQPIVITPEQAASVLRERARVQKVEVLWALMLDTKNRLIGEPRKISEGTLNASLAHPRELFAEALECRCAGIILVHNHPSGDPSPSAEDIRITKQMVGAGNMMSIKVFDHIILGRRRHHASSDFLSLRETGLVEFG